MIDYRVEQTKAIECIDISYNEGIWQVRTQTEVFAEYASREEAEADLEGGGQL